DLRQEGLHKNLQLSLAGTEHRHLNHARGRSVPCLRVWAEDDETRKAVRQRLESLTDDGGPRAVTAHPAFNSPARQNQRPGARDAGGRLPHRHDGCQRERAALRAEPVGFFENVLSHGSLPPQLAAVAEGASSFWRMQSKNLAVSLFAVPSISRA